MAHTPKPIRRAQKPFNARVNKWKREMSRRQSQVYGGIGKNVIFIDEFWTISPKPDNSLSDLLSKARSRMHYPDLTTITIDMKHPKSRSLAHPKFDGDR